MYSTTTELLKKRYIKRLLFQSNTFFYRVYDYQERVLIFSSNSFDNAIILQDILNKVQEELPNISFTTKDFSDYIILPILMPNINSGELMLMETSSKSEEVLSLRDMIEGIQKDMIGAIELFRNTKIVDDAVESIREAYNSSQQSNESSEDTNTQPNIIERIKQSLLNNAATLLKNPTAIYSMRGFKIWTGSSFATASLSFELDVIGIAVMKLKKDKKRTLVASSPPTLRTINWEDIDIDSIQYLFPFLLKKDISSQNDLTMDEKLKIVKKLYRLIGQYVITYSIILPILYIQKLKQIGMKLSTYAFIKFEDSLNEQWTTHYIPVMYVHSFGEGLKFNANSKTLQPFGIPKQFTIQSNLTELTYGLMRIINEVNKSFIGLDVESGIGNKNLQQLMEELGGPSTFPQLLNNPLRSNTSNNTKSTLMSLYPQNISFAFNRGNINELLKRNSISVILKLNKDLQPCYEKINEEFERTIKATKTTLRDYYSDTTEFLNAFNFIRKTGLTAQKVYVNSISKYSNPRNNPFISEWENILFPKIIDIYPLLLWGNRGDGTLPSIKPANITKRAEILWNYILMQLLLLIPILKDLYDAIPKQIIIHELKELLNYMHEKISTDQTIKKSNWTLTSSYRNYYKQLSLPNQSTSTDASCYKATPFCSPHNYALAIDMAIHDSKTGDNLQSRINALLQQIITESSHIINLIKNTFKSIKLSQPSQWEKILNQWIPDKTINPYYTSIGDHSNFGFFWITPFSQDSTIEEHWHFSMRGKLIKGGLIEGKLVSGIPAYQYFCSKAKSCKRQT